MIDLATELRIRPSDLGRWRWIEVQAIFDRRAEHARKRSGQSGNLMDMDPSQMAAAMGAT